MYYTIYKVTNQIDGKFYIGSHKTKNLNDNYMGSGKYLKHAQAKYGIENFTKEILFVFDTPELMYSKEAELVNEEFLATENTYNLKIGGFGGWDYANSTIDIKSRNIKSSRNGNIDNKRSKTVSKHWLDGIYDARLLSENFIEAGKIGFKDKKHNNDTKHIIGRKNSIHQGGILNSQYGTMWITNGVESKKIKKNTLMPDGWILGRKIKV